MTDAPPAWRREGRAFVELFAMSGVAIALPLLDTFGRAMHQFVFRGAEASDIVLFGLAVTFVPPLVLWFVEAVVGLVSSVLRRALHQLLLGVLAGALAVQLLRPVASEAVLFVAATVLALAAVLAYRRFVAARMWLGFLAIAPVVFLVLFLVASPTARLLSDDIDVARVAGVGAPAPVVVLVFDELPLVSVMDSEGQIDAELFPNFAELAAGSHWFRNTTTPSPATWYAMPTMLTGVLPADGHAPLARDHPNNLFTLLADSHRLNVVETYARLCPSTICEPVGGPALLYDDALEVILERLSWTGPEGEPVAGFVEKAADAVGDDMFEDLRGTGHSLRVERLTDGIVDRSLAVHFLHLLLPHQPLRYLPSGAEYDGPDPDLGRDGDDFDERTWPPVLSRHRHVLQVAYADALLGTILDQLRAVGVYDDAVIAVLSDHGIAFQPGRPTRLLDAQRLDDDIAPEIMWVPFFLKLPGQVDPVVSDANVLTTDLLPTLADVLELDLRHDVDGISALGPPRSDGAKPFRHIEFNPFGIGATDLITIDGDAFQGALRSLGIDRFLPHRGSPDRLWQVGPSAELVGQPAEGLPLIEADVHGAPFDVEPGAIVVPALVRADVAGVAPGDALAVAVDGIVAATAVAFEDEGGTALAVMVDDARFRAGRNEITVHRVP